MKIAIPLLAMGLFALCSKLSVQISYLQYLQKKVHNEARCKSGDKAPSKNKVAAQKSLNVFSSKYETSEINRQPFVNLTIHSQNATRHSFLLFSRKKQAQIGKWPTSVVNLTERVEKKNSLGRNCQKVSPGTHTQIEVITKLTLLIIHVWMWVIADYVLCTIEQTKDNYSYTKCSNAS